MTIYGIGGVSGAGKTYFRTQHCKELMKDARVVDIAEVYEQSIADGHPNLNWRVALDRFVTTVRRLLEEDRAGDIVLEAFFRADGIQRAKVQSIAEDFRVAVKWGWAAAPRNMCLRRVEKEKNSDSLERKQKRTDFIQTADIRFFRDRPGETLEDLTEFARQKAKAREKKADSKGGSPGELLGSAKKKRGQSAS